MELYDFMLFHQKSFLFIDLLNLRGSDIEFNPVFFSYVTIEKGGILHWFIDSARVTDEILSHFNKQTVQVS